MEHLLPSQRTAEFQGWFLLPFADNHDIISLKLYQLTVERTPEEEKRDREVFLPVVDNLKLPGSEWEFENGGSIRDLGWGVELWRENKPQVWGQAEMDTVGV